MFWNRTAVLGRRWSGRTVALCASREHEVAVPATAPHDRETRSPRRAHEAMRVLELATIGSRLFRESHSFELSKVSP